MIIELAMCTKALLDTITLGTRNEVAQTYALAMVSSEPTDWPTVNEAIIARWSRSALEYIKRRAWSLMEGKR